MPTTDVVHPSPIYETLRMGSLGFVLWQLRDRVRPGGLFVLYLIFAGLERFFIEFVRRNDPVVSGLTAAQVESVGLAFAGAALWAWVKRRDSMQLGARGLGWQT